MNTIERNEGRLFYTDLRGHWPVEARGRLLAALPAERRRTLGAASGARHASLAGIALALEALRAACGREVLPRQLEFPPRGKPLLPGGPDFSISHSGPWAACAVVSAGRVGCDVECVAPELPAALRLIVAEPDPVLATREWAAREAALKVFGDSVRNVADVRVSGSSAHHRGQRLHVLACGQFPGAEAVVVTTAPLASLMPTFVALRDLAPA
jgi:phosphopantetheinyl transferase